MSKVEPGDQGFDWASVVDYSARYAHDKAKTGSRSPMRLANFATDGKDGRLADEPFRSAADPRSWPQGRIWVGDT